MKQKIRKDLGIDFNDDKIRMLMKYHKEIS